MKSAPHVSWVASSLSWYWNLALQKNPPLSHLTVLKPAGPLKVVP